MSFLSTYHLKVFDVTTSIITITERIVLDKYVERSENEFFFIIYKAMETADSHPWQTVFLRSRSRKSLCRRFMLT